jgi:hypothetical protein
LAHLIDKLDKPSGPPSIAQLCVSEIHFTETFCLRHTRPSVNNRAGYHSVTRNHSQTIKPRPMLAHAFKRNRGPYKFAPPMQPAAFAPYNPHRSPTQKPKTRNDDTCEPEQNPAKPKG